MPDQAPHVDTELGPESYSAAAFAERPTLYSSLELLFPWNNTPGRKQGKVEAMVALFSGRATAGTIRQWRYRERPPDWARLLVAETLERRAAAFLAEANRLRSL